MNDKALVIVDMQEALVSAHPCDEETVVNHIARLSEACRAKGIPVIYIRHDGGAGDELEKGSDGWQVYHGIPPREGEKTVDKRFNSMFKETELDEYLKSRCIKHLIMCGMQTEYCFDVSCKVAFEYGYRVTVPKGTVTTFDNEFSGGAELTRYFEEHIWNGRYAEVKELDAVLAEIGSI